MNASHYASALILAISCSLGGMILFGTERINRTLYNESPWRLLAGLLVIVLIYILRETFQGMIWCMFTGRRLGSIRLWQCMNCNAVRCCVCDELTRGEYLWGLFMPVVLFTAVPFVSACIRNDPVIYLVGVCALPSCGNDIVTMLNLLHYTCGAKDIRIILHHHKSGCIVFYR